MPDELRIAAAQFENRSGDKAFNLATIEDLSAKAARSGANVAAFHECSITGYSFARRLSREQLWDLAEAIPDGASIEALVNIAHRHGIAVLAGLFGRGDDGEVYKAHVCVATCSHEKIALSGGHRYREARKPELYGHVLGAEHHSEQTVPWMSGRGGS